MLYGGKNKDIISDTYNKESKRILEDENKPSPEFFIKKYRLIQKLLGPSEITYYNIDNKFILLFEDLHMTPFDICNPSLPTSKMINIFLKDLFKCSPVCIDYFQETTSFRQLSKNQKHLLKDKELSEYSHKIDKHSFGFDYIFDSFYQCLGPNKKNCSKFGKVRFHNIEFRRFYTKYPYDIMDIDYAGNSIFCILLYYLESSNKKISFPFTKTKYDKNNKKIIFSNYDIKIIKEHIMNLDILVDIINNFIDGDMKLLSENILQLVRPFKKSIINSDKIFSYFTPENLIENSIYMKISKQLNKLDKNIIKNIKTFFKDEIKIYIVNNIKYIQKNINLLSTHQDIVNFYNWYYENIMMIFNVIIFDIYTISRFMKSMYVYNDSSFIVIYAGLTHTERYRRFIDKYIKNIKNTNFITNTYNDRFACIDLVTYNDKWQKTMDSIEKQLKMKPMSCKIND